MLLHTLSQVSWPMRPLWLRQQARILNGLLHSGAHPLHLHIDQECPLWYRSMPHPGDTGLALSQMPQSLQ